MNYWVKSFSILFAIVMMVICQEDDVFDTLGLAEQAFDDQYLGCKRKMERKLEEDDVLHDENEKNRRLKRAWKESSNIWMTKKDDLIDKLPQDFNDDHGIALLTYTSFIRKDFNDALKVAGKSYDSYMNDFGFKWLHFYVTAALQLMSRSKLHSQYTVYSGVDDNIEVPPNGSIYVKFGHFLYTSLDVEKASVMGNKSLLIIEGYPGVNIENFSQFSSEREVLVPGYEVFSLSPMEQKDHFKLHTTRKFCSNFNCAYIDGENSKRSVRECINAAASRSRMHSAVHPGLVTVLIMVVVTLL